MCGQWGTTRLHSDIMEILCWHIYNKKENEFTHFSNEIKNIIMEGNFFSMLVYQGEAWNLWGEGQHLA